MLLESISKFSFGRKCGCYLMPEMKKNSLQQPDATRNALVVKQQRRLYGGKDP
jgi:hypothetical protein